MVPRKPPTRAIDLLVVCANHIDEGKTVALNGKVASNIACVGSVDIKFEWDELYHKRSESGFVYKTLL